VCERKGGKIMCAYARARVCVCVCARARARARVCELALDWEADVHESRTIYMSHELYIYMSQETYT